MKPAITIAPHASPSQSEAAWLRFALWLVERLAPSDYASAIAGDLLEVFHAEGASLWLCRQILHVAASGLLRRSTPITLPLAFSVGWSILYPVWQLDLWRSAAANAFFHRWGTLGWPYSASFALGHSILPAVSFLWFGLFCYLLLRLRLARSVDVPSPSAMRLLGSLSLSLNVLLVAAIGLSHWHWLGSPGLGSYLSSAAFRGPMLEYAQRPSINVPLACALFSAILTALPPVLGHRSKTALST